MSVAFFTAMTATTQRQAHAYAVGGGPRTTPGAAKAIVTATPWGRGIMTAITIATLIYDPGGGMPWSKKPGQTANDDQVSTYPNISGYTWGFGPRACLNWSTGHSSMGTAGTCPVNYGISEIASNISNQNNTARPTFSVTATVNNQSSGWGSRTFYTYIQCSNNVWYYNTGNGSTSSAVNSAVTFTVTNPCAGSVVPKDVHVRDNSSPGSGQHYAIITGVPAPTTVTPNPQRQTRPYSECSATPGGTSYSTIIGNATNYKEADTTYPPIIPPACPESLPHRVGFGADTVELDGTYPDRKTAIVPKIKTTDVIPSGYPECLDLKCVLTKAKTAMPGPVTNPDGTTTTTAPAPIPGTNLFCTLGPYNVPASHCQDTDIPAYDPVTATPAPTASATPTPVPVVDPCPPGVNTVACADASGSPAVPGTCKAGWSFNPVDWVIEPLKCLFIPSDQAVQDAASAISTAWDGTAPATVMSAMTDAVAPIVLLKDTEAQQNCAGPAFNFPALAGVTAPFTIHPLSTCNALTSYMLGIYMPLATGMVYMGGFFAGTRVLLKSFDVDSPVAA